MDAIATETTTVQYKTGPQARLPTWSKKLETSAQECEIIRGLEASWSACATPCKRGRNN
jgi:hypothetical protein